MNVRVTQFSATTIRVSWTKLTLVDLKGLANYVVTYSDIIISPRKREFGGMITVPWTNRSAVITNLQPGAQYIVSVKTSTSTGISG